MVCRDFCRHIVEVLLGIVVYCRRDVWPCVVRNDKRRLFQSVAKVSSFRCFVVHAPLLCFELNLIVLNLRCFVIIL